MKIDDLTTIVTLIVALSLPAERLVEIIKGLFPKTLGEEKTDLSEEAHRRLFLHILAIAAGMATACLAFDVLPTGFQNTPAIVGLGLLASGGSGFWNSILSYLTKVKEIKREQVAQAKITTARVRGGAIG